MRFSRWAAAAVALAVTGARAGSVEITWDRELRPSPATFDREFTTWAEPPS